MIAFYDPQQHHSLAFVYGQDPGVHSLTFSSWILWPLGYPDQALKRGEEAIALARKLDHPFSLCFALCTAGALPHMYYRREFQAAQQYIEPVVELSEKHGFAFYQSVEFSMRGRAQVEAGQVEEGMVQIRHALAAWQAMDTMMYRPWGLAELAAAYGKAGQVAHGLSVLAEALELMEKTGERFYEAESYRIKGELLLMQHEETEAEVSFRKAIEVARRQQAKSWELRAAMSLSRLWQKQGKREEARELLSEIYAWFTEGFDTSDLKDAKALLEELS
jgi:predicted ATPase